MQASAWIDVKYVVVSVVSVVIVALSGVACDPCADVSGPFSAELGTGTSTFEPLVDGASLPYVRGLQGGTHVDGAVRVRGLYLPPVDEVRVEELVQVAFSTFDGDSLIGGFTASPRTFVVDADGAGVHSSEPVIFFEDASAFVGKSLRLLVDVQDRCGHAVSDEATIVLRDAGT